MRSHNNVQSLKRSICYVDCTSDENTRQHLKVQQIGEIVTCSSYKYLALCLLLLAEYLYITFGFQFKFVDLV